MAEFRIQVVVDPSRSVPGTRRVRDELGRTENAANRLRNAIAGAFAFVGVAAAVREITQLVDTFTNLQNRLRTVTDGQQQLAAVTEQLFLISNRTRSSFEATAELYARVGLAARDLGVSQSRLLEFTESLNQAVILSGASATEAQAGLIQLSQGLASGALRGDELRSVLEQLPVVADVIAGSLGVTRGELRELGAEGRISAATVLNAFAEAREELEDRFGQAVPTIGQSFTVLRNNILDLIGTLDQSLGASATFSQFILSLANNVDTLARSVAALALTIGTQLALRAVPAAIAAINTLTVAIAANPIGAVAVALTATISLLVTFSDRIFLLRDRISSLADIGQATFRVLGRLLSRIVEFFSDAASGIGELFASIVPDINFNLEEILIGAASTIDGLIGLYVGAADAIVQAFRSIPVALELIFINAFNAISRQLTAFFNNFAATLSLLPGVTLDQAEAFQIQTELTFGGIGQGIGEAFTEGFRSTTVVGDVLNEILDEAESIARQRAEDQVFGQPVVSGGVGGSTTLPDAGAAGGSGDRELDTVLAQLRELTEIQNLLDQAFARGAVSAREYQLAQADIRLQAAELSFGLANVEQRLREVNVQILELAVSSGQGSFADGFLLQLNRMTEGLTNFSSDAGTVLGNFTDSFTQNFSNAIGQAVVGAQSLNEALRNVATQAISQLISSLVQLGIRYAINAALGRTIAAAATAASAAQASALAAAWAPAAALASLATGGANATGAIAGITATTAASTAVAATAGVPGFQDGGLFSGVGGPRSDSNLIRISDGEFIVNAAATRRNLALLEDINAGRDVSTPTRAVVAAGGGSSPVVNVEVVNNAPGVALRQERVSEDRIRVIAEEVVDQRTDSATAQNLSNPQSRTTRALERTTNTTRNLR